MAALPQREHGTPQAIHALHERRVAAEAERPYLGWSQIGEECDRALWYGFRWVGRKPVEGRIARLFETGNLEEARVLAELRALGYEVHDRDEGGAQFGVSSIGGHLRGHADAVVLGLPEAPKTWHLVDVKTASKKKFDELLKKGLRAMYPKYHAQGQGYMGHLKLGRAAFIFVCKDDDRIHVERFEFDRAEFERLETRAQAVIAAPVPPLRLSDDPGYFGCKFCDFHAVCHGPAIAAVNCRTCAHVTPEMSGDGAWSCERKACDVTVAGQRAGCVQHLFIPPLLARLGEPVDGGANDVIYQRADGGQFVNGPAPGFSSIEIVRLAATPEMLTDRTVAAVKAAVPTARVISGTGFDDMDDDIPY